MVRPVDARYPITLGYRQRMKSRPLYIHRGIDFGVPVGTPVKATIGGTVIHAGRGGMGSAFGIHVVLKTAGAFHIYAHLSAEIVANGQTIKTGQQLGRSGATGNVTGPHLHYGEFRSFNYLQDRTPQFIDAEPTKALVPWFDGLAWNLAGFDTVHGKGSWDQRIGGIVKAIAHYDRDIVHLLEVPNGKAADLDKRLRKIGWRIVVRTDGRCIAVRLSIRVGRTKVITLSERGPAKDDKQIVLAEVFPSGSKNAAIIESGHFEYRDGAGYDKARVKQGKQTRSEAEKFAKECGVPVSRIVFYNDENSGSQVSAQAFGSTFTDLAERDTYVSPSTSTLIPWTGVVKSNGYRPDKVHVHKDRPARGGTSVTFADDKLSDHLPLIYTVGQL